MKIFILSDGSSIHTRKWVNSLVHRGMKIHLFSLKSFGEDEYPQNDFTYTVIDCQKRNSGWGGLGKIGYLKALPELKKQISRFAPDIVHAHFASSYGLLGALSGFHPLIVSVWGYDIYDFPEKSVFHRFIIKYNLSKADKILSTSEVMAEKTKSYTKKDVAVTPFGIALDIFTTKRNNNDVLESIDENDIVVGTVKLLEKKYGIEYLIESFAIVVKRHKDLPLKLLIVGGGGHYEELKKKTIETGVEEKVFFTGMVPHSKIPVYQKRINIFSALSVLDSESFGVAVVEAQACGVPVVVSDAGGLPEVVEDGVSGFVVPRRNALAAAEAIEKLIIDRELREKMGIEGRKRVERLYDWEQNVDKMVSIYNNIILENHGR